MYTYFCTPCKLEFTHMEARPHAPCPSCRKGAARRARSPHASAAVTVAASSGGPRSVIGSVPRAVPGKLSPAVPLPVPVPVPKPVPAHINLLLTNELLSDIMRTFDERTLAFLGMVCKRWKPLAGKLLQQFVPYMTGHGSTTGPLKHQITHYLTGAHHVRLAVDQFPYPSGGYSTSILNHILANKIKIDLSLGTRDDRTMRALQRAGQDVRQITTFHKMHNKLWVIDHEGVILGSPNVSFSALEGGNLESCIYIRSPRLGALFAKYIALLGDWRNNPLWYEVRDAMRLYNEEEHATKIALAPIMNITDFVVEQLQDATKIIIRQFLISPKNDRYAPGRDIVGFLCYMSEVKKVEIEIYLDHGAYTSPATGRFVQKAIDMLVNAGCKVYTQTPVLVINTGGEKIQHDKLILATVHGGVLRTLIGSAGFTRDVIANNNAENFISTDVASIHASLMAHHLKTWDSKVATTYPHHDW